MMRDREAMMSSSTDPTRAKVFVSYSHVDEAFLLRLQTHLGAYPRRDLIDYWDDTRIAAGKDFQQEIAQAVAATKIAVLLLSADYMADQSIYTYQLQPLLQAHRQGLI